jgi:hypothetical protein
LGIERRVRAARQHVGRRRLQQVVRHEVRGLAEPEARDLGQHLAFARNRVRQHHVERREAIGRDDQQPVARQREHVAHLATVDKVKAGQVGLQQGCGQRALRRWERRW